MPNDNDDKNNEEVIRTIARAAGQYRKATLFERFGADANTVDLRLVLAHGCPKIAAGKEVDACGVYYPERIG